MGPTSAPKACIISAYPTSEKTKCFIQNEAK